MELPLRAKECRDSGRSYLFRARLDQRLPGSAAIDWRFPEARFGVAYTDTAGHPPLPTRLMAGLAILELMHDLSDGALCERRMEKPCYQFSGNA